MDPSLAHPPSTIGRLLAELSWEGANIRAYRQGGLGRENVLTAEALAGLDYLPRTAFLGAVLGAAHGADAGRAGLVAEIETADLTLLPGDLVLAPHKTIRAEKLIVQPDGLLESSSCFCLIEAKRIRSSSFQAEQLAREYVVTHREARARTPLLLLVLGQAPPVKVARHRRLPIEEALMLYLDSVLTRADIHDLDGCVLADGISEAVAWITWSELRGRRGACSIGLRARRPLRAWHSQIDWHFL